MDMMDQRDLQYFLAVAGHGTVSAAAAAIYVSQPAVSRRIAGLERKLGVRLFRRTASGMKLTPAGERVRELAQDLQNRQDRADGVLRAMRRGHQSFTVACPETTGNFFIAPFIAEGAPIADIQPAHPGEVYARLSTGVDMAVNTSEPPPHLRGHHLASAPVFVHFRPGDRLAASGGEAELTDVAREAVLLPGHGSAIERTVRDTALAGGIDLALARTTSNGTMAQAMAAAGHGKAVTIEPAGFGLESAFLVHRGRRLSVGLYAGWEPDHYAAAELGGLAAALGVWMQARIPRLTTVGPPHTASTVPEGLLPPS